MKNTILNIIFCSLAITASAQVSIGGKHEVEGNSTILDFNSPLTADTNGTTNNNFRGIIISATDNSPVFVITDPTVSSDNNGTFVFDRTLKKVRMFENNTWIDLSNTGDSGQVDTNVNTSDESTQNQGVIIGADTSNAKGVLVLESVDKAVILPRIANPHTTVKSPYPGMLCYDTMSKSLALFDGSVWNYWK